MRLIRGAGAGGRRKDRGGVHAFRAAVQTLREGRSVGMTADVPGSGEARRAGLGVVMVARAVRPAGHAAGHRHLALRGAEHLEPHDHQPAVVEPGLRGGRCRACAARRADGDELEVYRLAVERSLNAATVLAYARAAVPMLDGRRRAASAPPGLRLKAYRTAHRRWRARWRRSS